MKRIITTTAFALMLGGSALAQSQAVTFNTYTQDAQSQTIAASNLIGMRVHAVEKDYDSIENNMTVEADAMKEWNDIGEVNDVILGRDGEIKAVVLGVGGFIGVGEKDVAVPMESIKFVNERDDAGDFFLVVNANKQALTDAEGYERQARMKSSDSTQQESSAGTAAQTAQNNSNQDNTTSEQSAESTVNKSDNGTEASTQQQASSTAVPADRQMLRAPDIARDGYTVAERDSLTTEDLTGARVYGSNDEDVGEIDRLLVTENGEIDRAVIDVGGFLGLGEHPIAVTLDELRILRNENGDLRVYIDGTQAELEQQPAFRE